MARTFNDHLYKPQGASAELFTCRAPEVLIEGPAGTGKTRSVLEYVHFLCETYPGIRVLLFRKTRTSMNESVLVTFEQEVLWEGHECMVGDAHRNNRQFYEYPNGSHIVLGGMDNSDRIMSTQYDIACGFEATELSQEDWEKVQSRLRNNVLPWQQGVCDCNPGAQGHWLNVRAHKGKMVRLLSRHEDNPTVTPEYLAKLSNLEGARRLRLLKGEWCTEEGAVYDWDPLRHMLEGSVRMVTDAAYDFGETDEREAPTMWKDADGRARIDTRREGEIRVDWFFGSIDWGFRNPGVFQVWAVDGEGRLYRVAEEYHTAWVFDVWADRIEELVKLYGVQAIVADPAEPRSIEMLNDRLGSYGGRETDRLVRKANNDWMTGRDAVEDALKGQKPGMRFLEHALCQRDRLLDEAGEPWCTEMEFPGFVWRRYDGGQQTKEVPDPTVADHGMDATRYAALFAWKRNLSLEPERDMFNEGTLGSLLDHEELLKRIDDGDVHYPWDEVA